VWRGEVVVREGREEEEENVVSSRSPFSLTVRSTVMRMLAGSEVRVGAEVCAGSFAAAFSFAGWLSCSPGRGANKSCRDMFGNSNILEKISLGS
jgi:hypothetical protein